MESGTWDSIAHYISTNTKPDSNVVEKFYNLVLEAQFVPPAVRENLSKKLTYEKKWETVIQYHSMMGNAQVTQNAAFGDSDRQLLDCLKNRRKRPDMTQLLNLKSRIGTCNKSWMESFIAENGITVLVKAMSARLAKSPLGELDAAILYELICCVKTTINSGMTMKIFLNTENALRTVTYSLLFEWKPLALQVLEVLSVISDYSNDAAASIVQHLRHLSRLRREPAFEFFAQALLDADVDVKAAVLQLINSLLAGLDVLSDRMALRNDLKVLKFGKLCELAVEDLDDELQTIKNTTMHQTKRPSVTSPTISTTSRSVMVGRNSSIGNGNEFNLQPDDVRSTRKLRMRAKHPSEANFKIFDDATMEQDELYADDGITPISPSQGIMMGTLEIPRSKLKTMMGFGNSTQPKSRYFVLNGENLNSWLTSEAAAAGDLVNTHTTTTGTPTSAPYSTLHGLDIVDIRPYSTNEELNAICDHTFEIITTPSSSSSSSKQQVHPFGTTSEDQKDYWITALTVVRDRMLLKKCSYTLLTADLDSTEFLKAAEMFRKQITVYEVIGHEDYQQSLTKSGVDVTSAMSLMNFIQSELRTIGMENKLQELLQEIVVIPAVDSKFLEIFWGQLIQTTRELKLIQQDSMSSFSQTAATAGGGGGGAARGGGASSLSMKQKETALRSVRVDTELCKQLLTKKEKTAQGKVASDLNKLTMELFTKNAEIERLSSQLELMRRSTGPGSYGPGSVGGGGGDHRSAKIKSNSVHSFHATPPSSPLQTSPAAARGGGDDDDDLGVTLKRKNPKPVSSKASSSGRHSYSGALPPTSAPPPPPSSPPPPAQTVSFAPPSIPAPAHVIAAAASGVAETAPPPPPSRPPPRLSQTSAAASSSTTAPRPTSTPPPPPTTPSVPATASVPAHQEERAASKPVGKMQPSGALAALFQGKQESTPAKKDVSPLAAMLAKNAPVSSTPSSKKPTASGGLAVTGSTRPIPIPPPLPGATGTGGAPPLPGGSLKKNGATTAAAVPQSIHQPSRKMRGVFWNKVPIGSGNQCALWTGIDMKKIDDLHVDYSFLEDAFSQADDKPSPMKLSSSISSSSSHLSCKPSSISLLDGKRTQNILISSGRVKKSPDDMVAMILTLDPSVLSLELTEILLTLAPTPEESTLLKNYPNPSLLGKAEQILLALGTIPRLKERLECHRVTFHWNKSCDTLTGNLHLLSKTCHELSSQESIRQLQIVMSVIVAIGNFLNGGTNRIATAVKLDSILKFATVKPNQQKGTLLHFACRQLRLHYPEACEFYQHWHCITTASEVSFLQLQQEFNNLKVYFLSLPVPHPPHSCPLLPPPCCPCPSHLWRRMRSGISRKS
jgi:hypothetical protein